MRVAGKNPSGKELERIKTSKQFDGKIFKNFSETPMMSEDASYFKMLKYFFKRILIKYLKRHCHLLKPI